MACYREDTVLFRANMGFNRLGHDGQATISGNSLRDRGHVWRVRREKLLLCNGSKSGHLDVRQKVETVGQAFRGCLRSR